MKIPSQKQIEKNKKKVTSIQQSSFFVVAKEPLLQCCDDDEYDDDGERCVWVEEVRGKKKFKHCSSSTHLRTRFTSSSWFLLIVSVHEFQSKNFFFSFNQRLGVPCRCWSGGQEDLLQHIRPLLFGRTWERHREADKGARPWDRKQTWNYHINIRLVI